MFQAARLDGYGSMAADDDDDDDDEDDDKIHIYIYIYINRHVTYSSLFYSS